MNETSSLVAGRYRLVEQIGRGGMGDVFKATDLHTGETVAIKRLHQAVLEENPDILDRFIREGDALRNIETILTEFPDPGFMERLMKATFGDQLADPYAIILSAVANQMLGRHDRAIQDTSAGLTIFPDLSDFYLVQGVSQCALGDCAAAETAFSQGLTREPDFWLLYLLRADARLRHGDQAGADDDLRALAVSPQADVFTPFAAAVRAGETDCATFLMPPDRRADP